MDKIDHKREVYMLITLRKNNKTKESQLDSFPEVKLNCSSLYIYYPREHQLNYT